MAGSGRCRWAANRVCRRPRSRAADCELSRGTLDRAAFAVDGADSSHGADPGIWRRAEKAEETRKKMLECSRNTLSNSAIPSLR
jgi:hypothetical protein